MSLSLSDLVAIAEGKYGTNEYENATEKMNSLIITGRDVLNEVEHIRKQTHLTIDEDLAFQIINDLKLDESNDKLYQILLGGMLGAYAVIEGQIGETCPDWKTLYLFWCTKT